MRWRMLVLVFVASCSDRVASTPPPPADAGGCGPEYLDLEYSLPDGTRRQICVPLPQGIQAQMEVCTRISNVGTAYLRGDPRLGLSAAGNPFAALGISRVGLIYTSRTECGYPTPDCHFVAWGSVCRLRVTRAGGLGDLVAGELAEPCTLTTGGLVPPLTVTVNRARVQATLTFWYDLAAVLPDGGQGVVDPECGPRRGVPGSGR